MTFRTAFIRRALSYFLLLILATTASADTSPQAFLESIYKAYEGKDSKGVEWSGSKFGQYFDKELTRLYEADLKEAKGEVGRLDGDPFLGAQDWEVSNVRVTVPESSGRSSKAKVDVTNMGKSYSINIALVKESAGWRISNVQWPDDRGSLRAVLDGTAK